MKTEDIILNLSVSICSLNQSNSAYPTAHLKGLLKAKEYFFWNLWVCWPEISRQPNISPAKNEFIWDQQRIAIWSLQPQQVTGKAHTARKGGCFHRGEKEVGRAIVKSPWLFLGWVVVRKEEDSFFFLLGFATGARCESLLLIPFNWGFCLLTFYIFY